MNIALYDFQGKLVASSRPHDLSSYRDFVEARTIIDQERQLTWIRREGDIHRLYLGLPVIYRSTGKAEGMLVLETELDSLFWLSGSFLSSDYLFRLKGPNLVVSHESLACESPREVLCVERELRLLPPLNHLELSIQLGLPKTVAFRELHWLTHGYLLTGLLALLLAARLAYYLGRRLTLPLSELSQAVRRIAVDGNLNENVRVHGNDEVGALSHGFNAMLEHLRASHALLEQRVEERTRELHLAAQVFEHVSEGIFITDAGSRIISVNRAFSVITGYRENEVAGRDLAILHADEEEEAFYQELWQNLSTRGAWRGECLQQRRDGELYPAWLSLSAVPDENGQVLHYIGVFTDISERKAAEALIEHQANYDALTDLPNRKLFMRHLEPALERAGQNNRLVALMFLDLDCFKRVNDRYGHWAGDRLLNQVAGRLRHCVRDTDTVARLGGDEFTVILPEVEQYSEVEQVAARIVEKLAAPFTLEGRETREQWEVKVQCSLGIACFPYDAENVENLLKRADAAMYQVKQAGGNHFQRYRAAN